MREHVIFFISIFIILLLSSIMLIHGVYNYRKSIKNTRDILKALKRIKRKI